MIFRNGTPAVERFNNAMLKHATMLASLIANAPLSVEWGSDTTTAYTDGKRIVVGSNNCPDYRASAEDQAYQLYLLDALLVHEDMHKLYSPSTSSVLGARIIRENLMVEWNALEDQRAESRGVHERKRRAKWLTMLVVEMLLKGHYEGDDSVLKNSYPLISGRLFLPKSIRDTVRAAYVHQDLIPDIDRIVDNYKSRLYPDDSDLMLADVREFHELLKDTGLPNFQHRGDCCSGDMSKDEVLDHSDFVDSQREEREDDNDQRAEEQGDSGQQDDPSDEASEGSSSEGDESDEGDSSKPNQSGKSEDAEAPSAKSEESASEEVRKTLEEFVNENKGNREQMENLKDAKSMGGDKSEQFKSVNVDMETQVLAQDMGLLFRQLQEMTKKSRTNRQPSGSLHLPSHIKSRGNIEQSFRQWEPNSRAAMVDLWVMFDTSPSTLPVQNSLGKMAWAIKHGYDFLTDGKCTVIQWASRHSTMYEGRERAESNRMRELKPLGGSTEPGTAIDQANEQIAMSRAREKVVIMLTDGQWYDKDIKHFQDMSAKRLMVGFNGAEIDSVHFPEVDAIINVNDPIELLPFVEEYIVRAVLTGT